MADNFEYTAKINAEVNGKQAVGEINAIVKELKELNKTAAKTLEEFANLNGKAFTNFASGTKQASAAVKTFSNDLSQLGVKGQLLGKVGSDLKNFGSSDLASKWVALNNEQQRSLKQLPRLSYALYDVSNTAAGTALAISALAGASLKLSADFETAFTNIERTTLTTESMLGMLKNQFLALSTEVPLAFTELARIGSLGAQLGVASSDLSGFTKTVAMFSATTNVSIDEAAKSFGSLGELLNVPASEFKNLGSAIAFVGVNSVATESEILSVANSIGGIANSANLSTEYTIGLSGALASLRVPAEQSRGALTRTFQEINRAALDNGPVLANFASIMGITQEQAKTLAETNLQGFFQQFITGLSGLDAQGITKALDSVNLADIRVTNTLTRLSKNLDVVNGSIQNSSDAYANGAFLALAYGYKVEDLASKFTLFQNSLMQLGAAFGDALGPAVGVILDSLSESINNLALALRTDAGKAFATITVSVMAFTAALLAVVATSAIVIATSARMKTAISTLGWDAASGGMRGLAASMVGVGVAGDVASTSMKAFKIALASTGIGLAVVALGTLAAAFMESGDSAENAFNKYVTDTSGLADAVNADIAGYEAARIAGDSAAMSSYVELSGTTAKSSQEQIDYQNKLRDTANVLGTDIPNGIALANDAIAGNTRYLGENTTEWIKNALLASSDFQDLINTVVQTEKVVGKLKQTGDKINFSDALSQTSFSFDVLTNTVATYGAEAGENYVRGLLSAIGYRGPQFNAVIKQLVGGVSGYTTLLKMMDISTEDAGGSTAGLTEELQSLGGAVGDTTKKVRTLVDYANDLSSTFQRAFDIRWKAILNADEITDGWEKLAERIDDAKDKINGLTNTRDKLEYFLSIAVAAGDQLRANEIRNELAKTNKDLANATDDASTELNGNSAAARRNRKDLDALLRSNAEYITSLAEQGASQETLRTETERLRLDFLNQGVAMGFSRQQLMEYSASFEDMNQIIAKTPRNVTVTANTDPALQALAEFDAKMKEQAGKTYSGGTVGAPNVGNGAAIAEANAKIQYYSNLLQVLSGQRPMPMSAINSAASSIDAWQLVLQRLRGYSSGGYTGSGGKYEPAGIVHRGEYVVPKSMVNQSTGLPYADALGRLVGGSAPAAPSYAAGGFVAGGSMMVSLSPDDRALLRGIGASGDVVVAVDSREIARANARGAKLVTAEGGYLV